jgi:archaellum component FlaF (FlaF/FlaG flagellin family)
MVMKKIFFLLAMLANLAASAQRTTPVTVANTKVDYSTKTVTFDLSWKGSDATHRDEVWVFVDIQPVTGANTLGSWSPATLVPGATTVTAGSGNQYSSLTHTVVSGNTRGVWVKGTASNTTRTFAATVKVTLASATPAKFNACAYVTDYPPNARITSGSYSSGTYTLKGTQPFVINGASTVNATTYSAARISSITDVTQCPGYRCSLRDEAVGAVGCCTGLTVIGSYCRDLVADAASSYTCNGVLIEVKNASGSRTTWSTANSQCNAIGWRLPSFNEVMCMYKAKKITGTDCGNTGNWTGYDWWVNDCTQCRTATSTQILHKDNCNVCACGLYNAMYFCVRN